LKIRLSEAERERLGAPEVIDADIQTLPVREAIALEEATGVIWADAERLMRPTFRTDDAGEWASWSPGGFKLRLWLGLFRAGVEVDYDALDSVDFQPYSGWFPIPVEALGKAEGSPNAEPNTPSTSRSSTRHTRSKPSPK
jgi:hypothetical protein